MKQLPITNEELDILIQLLRHAVPAKDEEEIVFNLVNRMKVIRLMT